MCQLSEYVATGSSVSEYAKYMSNVCTCMLHVNSFNSEMVVCYKGFWNQRLWPNLPRKTYHDNYCPRWHSNRVPYEYKSISEYCVFSRLRVLRNPVRLLTNGLWLKRPRVMTWNFVIIVKIGERYIHSFSDKKIPQSLNAPVIHTNVTI
jgi:hypothetical protein